MAREKQNFMRGMIGPLILKVYGKKTIVAAKMAPGTMKQTSATRKLASEFGVASKLGKQIRKLFEDEIGIYRDAEMHNRLTKELHNSLLGSKDIDTGLYHFHERSFNSLASIELELKSGWTRRLRYQPTFLLEQGTLHVKLFDENDSRKPVQFPGNTSSCQLTLSVALFRLAEGLMVELPERREVTIERFGKNVLPNSLTFTVPDGCLCVVGIFLKYYNGPVLIAHRKWHAGGFCYATVTPGIFKKNKEMNWIEMDDFKLLPRQIPPKSRKTPPKQAGVSQG